MKLTWFNEEIYNFSTILSNRYIYKGPDRSSFAITEASDETIDTIKQWKSLRCLTATEAAWRSIIKQMSFRTPAAEGAYPHTPTSFFFSFLRLTTFILQFPAFDTTLLPC